jgi:hypothetical protein
MKTKVFVLVLLVFAASFVALIVNRQPASETASREPQPAIHTVAQPEAPPVVEEVQPPPEPPKPEIREAPKSPAPSVPVMAVKRTNTPPATVQPPPANGPQRELQDPLARVALAYVGQDPDAEAYWAEAIFDPSLPDAERDDLMEDLNEVGFSDPQHPGPQDLPLIVNRIQIIEQVAPYADNFMLPHLAEAYKDLVNMYYGQPPQ